MVKRLAFFDAINFSMTSKIFIKLFGKIKNIKTSCGFQNFWLILMKNTLKLLKIIWKWWEKKKKKNQTKLKNKIIKNSFILNIIDLKVQKSIYQLLPFRIFCHLFFCWKGSKTAAKCLICTRIFVDNYYIGVMFEEYFVLKKKNISNLPILGLMETVKVKSVSLNVYYMVGDFGKKFAEKKLRTLGIYIFFWLC